RASAPGMQHKGRAAGEVQGEQRRMRLQGTSCPGSCLCGLPCHRGPGMTRLVVVWDLKVAGASFEINYLWRSDISLEQL
ncbi:MAG: hypothetical protein K8S27_11670, partial [Candidatus Omnitrophica bacterium]|nr:hypothetical protein [Candidatus Omnitrophota bacterium]